MEKSLIRFFVSFVQSYVRTQEEISEAIDLANIKESELKQVSQVLLPPAKGCDASYKLMELDSHLLDALSEGSR